ncbi:uncharacterized protein BX663DRAFT_497055 [Cokeromyces recurvatus]|uniref:uncharacterized protein n=1 Tax=Cokeromyces recurvatus TaxID=90255 RepID=UPI0022200FA4|nr:uncharacterized protein BX663DRAFT_497055 [Cokeromyces recurvatus]KAI7906603.1 hypothetical protein BX663DRAFT_497055 [Cokeromyces recurvatus]
MACPCTKENSCSCTTTGQCKCGNDCACPDCKAHHQPKHKDTCACKGKSIYINLYKSC